MTVPRSVLAPLRRSAARFAAERLQNDPNERQSCDAKPDGSDVITGAGLFDRLIADVVGDGTANRRDQILPQMITSNALRTLQKKHDKAGKDDDCSPVVRRFHRFHPKLSTCLTTGRAALATAIDIAMTA